MLTLKTQRRKLANEQKRLEGLVAREMGVARELVAKQQKVRRLVQYDTASALGCVCQPSSASTISYSMTAGRVQMA